MVRLPSPGALVLSLVGVAACGGIAIRADDDEAFDDPVGTAANPAAPGGAAAPNGGTGATASQGGRAMTNGGAGVTIGGRGSTPKLGGEGDWKMPDDNAVGLPTCDSVVLDYQQTLDLSDTGIEEASGFTLRAQTLWLVFPKSTLGVQVVRRHLPSGFDFFETLKGIDCPVTGLTAGYPMLDGAFPSFVNADCPAGPSVAAVSGNDHDWKPLGLPDGVTGPLVPVGVSRWGPTFVDPTSGTLHATEGSRGTWTELETTVNDDCVGQCSDHAYFDGTIFSVRQGAPGLRNTVFISGSGPRCAVDVHDVPGLAGATDIRVTATAWTLLLLSGANLAVFDVLR